MCQILGIVSNDLLENVVHSFSHSHIFLDEGVAEHVIVLELEIILTIVSSKADVGDRVSKDTFELYSYVNTR